MVELGIGSNYETWICDTSVRLLMGWTKISLLEYLGSSLSPQQPNYVRSSMANGVYVETLDLRWAQNFELDYFKGDADTKTSLEKIKRQLASSSGRNLLQGPLLKRSETLRKWNERWVILDPTTGKMEYKIRRNEPTVKGTMVFDANSTITISPVNLHATQLVLKAHKEAVNTLSGNGSTKLGIVATVVAAANSTALEASKEIEAAMQISMRNALGAMLTKTPEFPLDDLSIMKETLRVKDEELQNLARDLRARDSTIKEIAEKLTETAEAAEAAASAAHTMNEQRRIACAEVERLTRESEKQLESSKLKIRELEEKVLNLSTEKDNLITQRDSALQEAHLWRSELAKAREREVILEGAVIRADEKVRVTEADAEARIKEAIEKESAAAKEKQELHTYVNLLQEQLKRQQVETMQVHTEKTEPCSGMDGDLTLTKHMNPSQENVDKACTSISRATTEARIADVREVGPDADRMSLDISVVNFPVNGHQDHRGSSDQP
ncbi:pleckstrin homology domain-containing family protein [Striga asiatica]|uniref:Pleckstrin homology domain-containing family protein n=1 Tax=Striga asiatica TaxID=4170 RepID=A0A5A7PLW8_STRAF|nr:pleckstrin homology domain-containing family protein [Striga asiatica]